MNHRFKILWTAQDEPYLLIRLLTALRKYNISPVTIKIQKPDSSGRTNIVTEVLSKNLDISVAIKKTKRLIGVVDIQYTHEKPQSEN